MVIIPKRGTSGMAAQGWHSCGKTSYSRLIFLNGLAYRRRLELVPAYGNQHKNAPCMHGRARAWPPANGTRSAALRACFTIGRGTYIRTYSSTG